MSDADHNMTENEHPGKEIGESLKSNKAIFKLHVGIIIIWAQWFGRALMRLNEH